MRQLRINNSFTSRDSTALDKYMKEIAREPLISVEEEVALAKKIKKGDVQSLEKLIKGNLRFVVSVAKQYQSNGLSLPDLINEGNIGLIKAAYRFDESKGFKFISYAVWWIRQSILQALAEQARIVRLPLNQLGTLNKIRKAFSQLEQLYGREPSSEELALLTDMSIEQVNDTLRVTARTVSVDAPVTETDDTALVSTLENTDTPGSDYLLMEESLQKDVLRSLKMLSPRESEVLKMYFGIGGHVVMSLEEISERFSLSRERVRQIKDNALRRLKSNRSRLLKGYLG